MTSTCPAGSGGPDSTARSRITRAGTPAYSDGRGIFEFQHPTDYPIALATDLQVRPPGSDYCRTCASATGDGLRLQKSVHHPVRDTLAWLLTAVLGERMVIRETPDGGGRMGSFMRRFPRLGHQPDIVLEGFDGRDSYTILEVKTCEPAGDAWIARQHCRHEPLLTYLLSCGPAFDFIRQGGPTRTSADVPVPRLAGFSLIT